MSKATKNQDVPEQVKVRRAKRERLLSEGTAPYPVDVERTHTLKQIRDAFVVDEDKAGTTEQRADGTVRRYLGIGDETDTEVAVAGRVIFMRNTGKLCFATLQEGDGTQLQAMLSLAEVGEDALKRWKSDVDMGDFVSIRGRVVSSRRGELSVFASTWTLASKALRPLPVSFADMNEDTRIRYRYTDLIMRDDARRMMITRVTVVRAVREYLQGLGFLEVETPMLQTLHGGAAARPFVSTLR